ncbi:hypothetical protein M407DRAFT_20381 [Tulasnella calospora MUT 4182]|uniref:RTA1 like protein n=1 Tax=Tulasnella calospora MUT 4182 TaxID=1051891 RepID=A0A0C3L9E4_9AGAM|nr:hypothetical protein M407DRAFT_20381 [Tulasnella calospora MUT 4182]
MAEQNNNDGNAFGYIPTLWITALFVGLFFLTTVVHIGQALYYKIWWLIPTFAFCGLGEVLGWAGRLWGSQQPYVLDPFLMQICCTIFSPTFLTAGMFFIFGRIIGLVGPEYSRLRPKTYAITFLSLDMAALIVQAVGGSQASAAETLEGANRGAKVMVGGIILQMVAITLYVLIQAEYLVRVFKDKPIHPRPAPATAMATLSPPAGDGGARTPNTYVGESDAEKLQPKATLAIAPVTGRQRVTKNIGLMLLGLVIATVFIYVRSIYRTIELLDGWNGPIITNETLFNVLDGMQILLAMVTLNVLHPGWLVPLTKAEAPQTTV